MVGLRMQEKYTNLKDGFIVRYADDFKIMCRTYKDAKDITMQLLIFSILVWN